MDSKEVDGKEVDSKVVDSKVAYSKNTDSRKVNGFLVDFALSLLLLSTKSCKERSGIYFLKLYQLQAQFSIRKLTLQEQSLKAW